MGQRTNTRNSGQRRSTNGQPGQWSPLRCLVQGPGSGSGVTSFVIVANQFRCSVNPASPDALNCFLTGHNGTTYETAQASAMAYQDEDAEGSIFSLQFPFELNTAWPYFVRIPAGWKAVRARDGSPIAGLTSPSGGVPIEGGGWIGLSNIADTPPPTGNPDLWVPSSLQLLSSTSIQFSTPGSLMMDPQAAPETFQANGISATNISDIGGGSYIASGSFWNFSFGQQIQITAPAYVAGWSLTDGTKLGLVNNLLVA